MVKSRTIVIILLSLFSFQLLPVKQVGSIIYANRLLEEMPNNSDGETAKFSYEIKPTDYLLYHYQDLQPTFFSTSLIQTLNIRVHTRNSDDIITPPPNNLV